MCDIYGNISENPLYQDPDNGVYQLAYNSPNVDAGNPDYTDQDGTVSDIGVYPFLQNIAIISAVPNSIDFDVVPVGEIATSTDVTIYSLGTIDLEITDILVSNDIFTVSPSEFTLSSGQTQQLIIEFSPTNNEPYSGTLTLVNNSQDDGELVIQLDGVGYIPPNIAVYPQQVNMSMLEDQSGITSNITIGNNGTDDLEWTITLDDDTRFETEWTFTNCGETGRYGPSQSQCNSEYGDDIDVNVSSGIQEWTVPYTGIYIIDVMGARGGEADCYGDEYYGYGARMKGEFQLTAGETIKILVGQKGEDECDLSPHQHHDLLGFRSSWTC